MNWSYDDVVAVDTFGTVDNIKLSRNQITSHAAICNVNNYAGSKENILCTVCEIINNFFLFYDLCVLQLIFESQRCIKMSNLKDTLYSNGTK